MIFNWLSFKTLAGLQVFILVGFMLFNATFNNISGISWQSVLLVEDPDKTTDLS